MAWKQDALSRIPNLTFKQRVFEYLKDGANGVPVSDADKNCIRQFFHDVQSRGVNSATVITLDGDTWVAACNHFICFRIAKTTAIIKFMIPSRLTGASP